MPQYFADTISPKPRFRLSLYGTSRNAFHIELLHNQEQNRNLLIKANIQDLPALPEGYFLLDYHTLNELVQVNNVLNIQLKRVKVKNFRIK